MHEFIDYNLVAIIVYKRYIPPLYTNGYVVFML